MGCGASKTPVVEEANKPTKAEPAADAGKASTSPAAPAAKAGTPAKSAASPAAKGGGATGSTPVVPLVPAAKGGAVIFCLGNEACGKEEICAKVAAEVGGSYLLATDLLRDAVESGSDEGNQLAEMIKQGKIVPASMTTALLTAAMADKPAPYLVDGFPKSLDNLGSFEEAVGACTLGLYFELPDDEARAAMLAQGKEAELIERKLRNFATQTVPITQALEGRALLRKIAAADRDAAMGDALAAVQALSGGAAAKPAKKAAAKPAATPKKAAAASSSAAAVEVPTGAAGVPIVFVLGGPGAGKTAICAKAVERFPSCSYFAAGDLIRDEVKKGTEQGRAIAEMIKEGKIVPTQVTIELFKQAMSGANGPVLIEGFPRSIDNLATFEEQCGPCAALLFLDVPEETMQARCLERSKASGRTDDSAETVSRRARTFKNQSMPVIDEVSTRGLLTKVDGAADVDAVFAKCSEAIAPLAK